MYQRQLNDDELRQYRPPSGLRPHRDTEPQLRLLLGMPPAAYVERQQTKRKSTGWIFVDSLHYKIKFNLHGTVVVKDRSGQLELRIQPTGEAGTNSRNKLTADQLANDWLIDLLIEIMDAVRAWTQAKGHQFPQGPSRLLQKACDALELRKIRFPDEEPPGKLAFQDQRVGWRN